MSSLIGTNPSLLLLLLLLLPPSLPLLLRHAHNNHMTHLSSLRGTNTSPLLLLLLMLLLLLLRHAPALLLCYADDSHTAQLSSLISSNPSLLLPALEAALRHWTGSSNGARLQPLAMTVKHAANLAYAPRADDAAFTMLTKFCKEGEDQQQQQQQQLLQLFALQASCLKCALRVLYAATVADSAEGCHEVYEFAHIVGDVCWQVVNSIKDAVAAELGVSSCHDRDSGSSGSSSTSMQESVAAGALDGVPAVGAAASVPVPAAASNAAAPWVALLARTVSMMACATEQQLKEALSAATAAAATATAEQDGPAAAPAVLWQQTAEQLEACSSAAAALTQALDVTDLPEDSKQQLREQHEWLQEMLGDAYDKAVDGLARGGSMASLSALLTTVLSLGLTTGESDDSAAGLLLGDVVGFAWDVTGYIPFSSGCNNPSCGSLEKSSELLLVGGKGCVCARCKAAR
jgi:hypothetical protein